MRGARRAGPVLPSSAVIRPRWRYRGDVPPGCVCSTGIGGSLGVLGILKRGTARGAVGGVKPQQQARTLGEHRRFQRLDTRRSCSRSRPAHSRGNNSRQCCRSSSSSRATRNCSRTGRACCSRSQSSRTATTRSRATRAGTLVEPYAFRMPKSANVDVVEKYFANFTVYASRLSPASSDATRRSRDADRRRYSSSASSNVSHCRRSRTDRSASDATTRSRTRTRGRRRTSPRVGRGVE